METTVKYVFRDGIEVDWTRVGVVDGKNFASRFKACGRCGGAGGSDAWKHTGWTCYDCGGAGGHTELARVYTPEEREALVAAATKRANTLRQKRELAEATARAEEAKKFDAWIGPVKHSIEQISLHAPILKKDGYPARIAGEVLSAVAARTRPAEWKIAAALAFIIEAFALREVQAAQQFVATVGERIQLRLTADNLRVLWESDGYPRITVYLLTMHDEAGNAIVYKGSSPFLDEGETGVFKVTVKEHDEYNGRKQTVVARAKQVSE